MKEIDDDVKQFKIVNMDKEEEIVTCYRKEEGTVFEYKAPYAICIKKKGKWYKI